jgi:hypothetical protein
MFVGYCYMWEPEDWKENDLDFVKHTQWQMKPFQQTIPLRLHIGISFHYQANKASNFRINEYQTKGKYDEWTIKPLRDTQI